MINFEDLTEEEIFIVKWKYRLAGDFETTLMRCMMTADEGNLLKLSHEFPKEVLGYKNYTEKTGWWDEVKKKANIPE